jgi:hypothetical protein
LIEHITPAVDHAECSILDPTGMAGALVPFEHGAADDLLARRTLSFCEGREGVLEFLVRSDRQCQTTVIPLSARSSR